MDEEVAMASGAGEDVSAGQADALGEKAIEEVLYISYADGEVVEAFAVFGEEAGDGGIFVSRFEEFEAGVAEGEHGGVDLFVKDGLFLGDDET
jgi:hypothetical protein